MSAFTNNDHSAYSSTGLGASKTGNPNHCRTQFHVASIAKPFTAFLILHSAINKQFSLDDQIGSYLGDEWPNHKDPKIIDLLNHTSGIHDFWPYIALSGAISGDIVSYITVRNIMRTVRTANFPPGDSLNYSNTGYLLLAELLEKIHGLPFSSIAHEYIFGPLGMSRTSFVQYWPKAPNNLVTATRASDDGDEEYTARYAVPGPTSLITTAEDLMTWSRFVLRSDDPAISEMLSPPKGDYPFDGKLYSKGLFHEFRNGRHVGVGHGGNDWGYFSSWWINLETQEASAILSSSNTSSLEKASMISTVGDVELSLPSKGAGRELPKTDKVYPINLFDGFILIERRADSVTLLPQNVPLRWDPRRGTYLLPANSGFLTFYGSSKGSDVVFETLLQSRPGYLDAPHDYSTQWELPFPLRISRFYQVERSDIVLSLQLTDKDHVSLTIAGKTVFDGRRVASGYFHSDDLILDLSDAHFTITHSRAQAIKLIPLEEGNVDFEPL